MGAPTAIMGDWPAPAGPELTASKPMANPAPSRTRLALDAFMFMLLSKSGRAAAELVSQLRSDQASGQFGPNQPLSAIRGRSTSVWLREESAGDCENTSLRPHIMYCGSKFVLAGLEIWPQPTPS